MSAASNQVKSRAMYDAEEYVAIISKFDLLTIEKLDPKNFVDFGIMDSKKYATKLFRIMEQVQLDEVAKTMVIVLATAVKNKKRVVNAMKKFKGEDWYAAVSQFFKNSCVQYTWEEEDDTFSVVHIPTCVPFLASRAWLQMTPPEECNGAKGVALFLSNLWAKQIYLDDKLLDAQYAWEANFWGEVVTKGGKNFEGKNGKGSFSQDYWKTGADDRYVLLNSDGTLFGTPAQQAATVPYSAEDLMEWFKTRVSHAADDSTDNNNGGNNDTGGSDNKNGNTDGGTGGKSGKTDDDKGTTGGNASGVQSLPPNTPNISMTPANDVKSKTDNGNGNATAVTTAAQTTPQSATVTQTAAQITPKVSTIPVIVPKSVSASAPVFTPKASTIPVIMPKASTIPVIVPKSLSTDVEGVDVLGRTFVDTNLGNTSATDPLQGYADWPENEWTVDEERSKSV